MGLSSTTNRVSFTGDGSSTVFAFPYYFFNNTDLQVYLYDTGSSVVYPQAIFTNYSVSGNVNSQGVFPSGGNVVMNSAFPSNLQLIVTRAPSPINNYSLLQNMPINSLALTQQIDYLTALVQRLQDEVSRCVQLPDGLGTMNGVLFNPSLPASLNYPPNGNGVLTLNSGATGWTFQQLVTSGGTQILPTINGGTGASLSLVQGSLIFAQTPSAMGQIFPVATGQLLTSQGSSNPAFQFLNLAASVTGILPTANGGLGIAVSASTGAIAYFVGSSFVMLPVGTQGGVLSVGSGSILQWQANVVVNPFTSAGDLMIGGSGGSIQRLGSGPQNFFLMANGSSAAETWNQINLTSMVTGLLPASSGGTGANLTPANGSVLYFTGSTGVALPPGTSGFFLTSGSSAAPTWSAGLTNPMTTGGDIIYGGASGVATRLPNGSSATVLVSQGGTNAPFWQPVGNVSRAPNVQTFLVGSSSQTYTTPIGTLYLEIEACGGGGGGGQSGLSGGTNGTSGGNTIFGSSLITCNGGAGGTLLGATANGGTAILGSSVVGLALTGGGGGPGQSQTAASFLAGGMGGANPFGGSGSGGVSGGGGGAPNTGAGGGGAGTNNVSSVSGGCGGGSGGYCFAIINTSILSSYTVIVGGAGVGGLAGGSGSAGGPGGAAGITITAKFQ